MRFAKRAERVQRIWNAVRLVAAVLVLSSIAADVVADARCHPAVRTSAATGTSAADSAGSAHRQDPCSNGCVPDCFCCSTLSPSPLPPRVGAVGLAVSIDVPAAPQYQTGVHPLPYRPPLAHS
jgi:hypothetical protein